MRIENIKSLKIEYESESGVYLLDTRIEQLLKEFGLFWSDSGYDQRLKKRFILFESRESGGDKSE